MMKDILALLQDIDRYIGGDDTAGDAICKSLEPQVRSMVNRFLGPHDEDGDDVVQDTLIAMLGYLKRGKTAPDAPLAFAVTIARNRCRNLYLWRQRRLARDVSDLADRLPHIAASPLDLIDEKQKRALLNEALRNIGDRCRDLLTAIYRQEKSMEALREDLGLKSVQAVYHRRNICIGKVQIFLNRRLFNCRRSGDGKPRSKTILRPDKESDHG